MVGIDAASQVSVGDNVRVAVTIESHGFDKRLVKVELKEGDKLLDSKDVMLSNTEQQHVDLNFKADKAGARYLTVDVPPQPEEAEYLRGNNSDTAFVRVSEEKIKVLYLEGLPRWDFRFLKNAMRRDNGLGRTHRQGSRTSCWSRNGGGCRTRRKRPPCRGRWTNSRNITPSSSATCRRRCSTPASSTCWSRRCASAASA